MRERWHHFLGRDAIDDLESRLAADEADLEFRTALNHSRQVRSRIDTRPISIPPEHEPSMEDLTAQLDFEDELVRGALDDKP